MNIPRFAFLLVMGAGRAILLFSKHCFRTKYTAVLIISHMVVVCLWNPTAIAQGTLNTDGDWISFGAQSDSTGGFEGDSCIETIQEIWFSQCHVITRLQIREGLSGLVRRRCEAGGPHNTSQESYPRCFVLYLT